MMQIARYEKRIGGWLFDKLLSLSVFAVVLAFEILNYPKNFSLYLSMIVAFAAHYVFYVLWNTFWLYFSNGFTLGGLIFGVRLVHATKERISWKEAAVKSLFSGVVAAAIVNGIYMLSEHTERSVFDRLSDTLCVSTRY
jgi:uncharacterized RDD family membrane protein YckC